MILDSFKLTGKNALVTGSSRGIGAAIAVAFAEAGANVAVHGSKCAATETARTVRDRGVRTAELIADLADSNAYDSLISNAVDALGPIDILVNNAGAIRRTPAVDYTEKDWYDLLQINLSSVFRLSQIAGRARPQRDGPPRLASFSRPGRSFSVPTHSFAVLTAFPEPHTRPNICSIRATNASSPHGLPAYVHRRSCSNSSSDSGVA